MKKLCYSLILFISFLSATIINVPGDYQAIQAGINASDDGDTVLIAQGIYFENLILQKEIVLASNAIYDDLDSDFHNNENINETIISGPPEPDDPNKGSCLVIRYGDIEPTIFGLTFQDGLGTTMSVSDCGVFSNERSGGAILIYEAYPTIVYNRFLNNGGGENTGGGVVAAVTNGGAISHYDTEDVEFDEDRNSSSQNTSSSRTIPGTLNIQNNYFEGNSSGDGENVYSHGYEGDIDVSYSVFEDIDCETNTVNEFVLQSAENAADYIQNDISGVCIESNSFYVSDDGDDSNDGTEEAPLKTIGHALSLVRDAETPTTIYLNPGVYSPSTNGERFPIVLPDNVELIGDESENTILDAEASANDQAAVMIIKEVESVRVANLTLSGGYSEGHGCTGGGGILVTADDMYNLNGDAQQSNPVIENVIIENNHSHNGGGVSFFRVEGPSISNAIIRNNTASFHGGGIFVYVSNTTITDVEIHNNVCLGYPWGGFDIVGHGGGLFLADGGGEFTGLNIHNNASAMHGGGMGSAGSGSDSDDQYSWSLTNSTIKDNYGPWLGGGLWIWDGAYGAPPLIKNVNIENNSSGIAGGGFLSNYTNPVFENCTIQNNEATGDGGGLCFWGNSSPVLTDCVISGNTGTGEGGGIYAGGGNLSMTRCAVVDNYTSYYNAGISVDGATATVTNCTISGNTSPYGAGIEAWNGGSADITNAIIWDNSPQAVSQAGGNLYIWYSDIEDGFDGEGNIDADPLFVGANSGDYTLSYESPCIDAGTADTDGDGNDDITDYNGAAPDMGAFETTMAAPTGFTLYPLETYVTLTWNAVSIDDFNYYIVERSTDVEFADDVESNALLVNYFEDHELEYDTEYFYRLYYVAGGSNSEYSDVLSVTLEWLDVDGDQLPTVYALHQNYPNPFNPVTSLSYDLPEDAMVNITVFDMMGRVVRTLANGQQSAGYKSLQWNGTNNSGHPISAGLYIYTIQAGEFSQTRKMIFLK